MCRHFTQDFGLTTRVVRYHNVYGPQGTFDGGREKAPAALIRKIIKAKIEKKMSSMFGVMVSKLEVFFTLTIVLMAQRRSSKVILLMYLILAAKNKCQLIK